MSPTDKLGSLLYEVYTFEGSKTEIVVFLVILVIESRFHFNFHNLYNCFHKSNYLSHNFQQGKHDLVKWLFLNNTYKLLELFVSLSEYHQL